MAHTNRRGRRSASAGDVHLHLILGEIRQAEPGQRCVSRSTRLLNIEPREKHWHGATPIDAMSHISITEPLDGTAVQRMEHLTDAQ